MSKEWENISEEYLKDLDNTMTELDKIDCKNQCITWLDEENHIDEVKFCEAYLQERNVKCINGSFFNIDGFVSDGEIEKNIYSAIKNHVARNVSKKVKQLLEVLRFESYSEELPIQTDRIHVKNGTIFLNGMFSSKKEFCLNRLPINYKRKSKQSVQGTLYVRFLCFGNGNLSSLYDRSYGFFRRQIVLTTKEKDKNRKNNPFLIEKLRAEKEGIFLWCLEGLKRLLKNDYEFTISEKANRNLYHAMEDGNNIISFMEADDFVNLEAGTMTTSKKLYACYCHWCDENVEKPMSAKSFISYLKQSEAEYNIQYSTNVISETGKKARGFSGIYIKIRM